MNQLKQTLFRLALLSGLVALRAPASTLLTPATTLADCAVDSARLLSPTGCALNLAGSASASLTLSPFVSLTAQAASPPNGGGAIHGAAASAVLTYSFEVIGGNPGDIVPVLIATSLSSLGSDPSHGIGFAELSSIPARPETRLWPCAATQRAAQRRLHFRVRCGREPGLGIPATS